MEITIYKDLVEEMFEEIKYDYDSSEQPYDITEIYIEIAKDFNSMCAKAIDHIEQEIEKMVINYIIDFKHEFNILDSVDTMVFNLVEKKGGKIKAKLLDKWEDLPEFENHKKEIDYLKHPVNIERILTN